MLKIFKGGEKKRKKVDSFFLHFFFLQALKSSDGFLFFFLNFVEKNFFDICLYCFDSIMAVKVVVLNKEDDWKCLYIFEFCMFNFLHRLKPSL